MLIRSYNSALWLCAPYVAWGILVICLNAVRYSSLSIMPAPIAMLNIIKFCIVRFYRCT